MTHYHHHHCSGDLIKHSPALALAELLHDINASVVDPSEVTEGTETEESDCKDSPSSSSSSSSSSEEGGEKGSDREGGESSHANPHHPFGTGVERENGFANHQSTEGDNHGGMVNNNDHSNNNNNNNNNNNRDRDSTTTTLLTTTSASRSTSPKTTASSPCNLANLGFPPVALFHGSHDLSVIISTNTPTYPHLFN